MSKRKLKSQVLVGGLIFSIVVLAGGCSSSDDDPDTTGGFINPAPDRAATLKSIASGAIEPLGDYSGIFGRAQIVRTLEGTTTVELHAEGLTALIDYPVHVHALPCSVDNAGGHYKIDPTIATAEESNEIWPVFTSDENGVGQGAITVDHSARPDAQSLVIHDPENGNAKMACADLVVPASGESLVRSGTLAPFAAAETMDENIAGTASLTTSATGTQVIMSVSGLDINEAYQSHVHQYPCSLNDAGGHYKIDPTIQTTEENNEIWPTLTVAGDGSGEADTSVEHIARADAQSVVIHRVVTGAASPKVACADLVRSDNSYVNAVTSGAGELLPAATENGYDSLVANGSMTRQLNGLTVVSLDASGLNPALDYGAHVHDNVCAAPLNGGGHYKIDPAISEVEENNELWLNFTSDDEGSLELLTWFDHLARPEAQSIVIHDASETADRLVCIELN
jgi:hypothetical protein